MSSLTRCFRLSLTSRPIIFEYIETLLGSAQSYSVLLIERAVVGLLRLCLIISESVSQVELFERYLTSSPSSVISFTSLWTSFAHSLLPCSMPFRNSSWLE